MGIHIQTAGVIGAGTMGSAIAAQLANSGIHVLLLDIVPSDYTDAHREAGLDQSSRAFRSMIATQAVSRLSKHKPAPLYLDSFASRIRPGNLEDDFDDLKKVDWIIEAVPESLKIKQPLFKRLESIHQAGQLVTSNTSGLALDDITDGCGEAFCQHVFITHFFNPPRYMHLLELVRGRHSSEDLFKDFARFAEVVLGKGIVIAKETPNFIANRIGAFDMTVGMNLAMELGLTVEEVDAVAGPAIGRPKSALFRLIDVVGVDISQHVNKTLYDSLDDDEARDLFAPHPLTTRMLEKGLLGQKVGKGFYQKIKDEKGRSVIQPLDLESLEYRDMGSPSFDSLNAARKAGNLEERLKALVAGDDKAAQFAWQLISQTICYAANRIPEISDDIVSIDNSMKWGYNWSLGPFETWDALGVRAVVSRLKAEGRAIPELVQGLLDAGHETFYRIEDGSHQMFDADAGDYVNIPGNPKAISLPFLRKSNQVIIPGEMVSLVDIGEGVGCVEFHSKANALASHVLDMIETSIAEAEKNLRGIVIGNQGTHFCLGADLAELMSAVDADHFDKVGLMIDRFHRVMRRIKFSPVPVITAIHGMVLGGGCELTLHADTIVAAPETYMGLVELGVGLIPAGGGSKEWAIRCDEWAMGDPGIDLFPMMNKTVDMIGNARTSSSADHARQMGYLGPGDRVVMNQDNLLHAARQEVINLADAGYRPPLDRQDIRVLGRSGVAEFKVRMHIWHEGGFISEYDQHLGNTLARVLCGGDVPDNSLVSEHHLLGLEKEAFLSLLGEQKTRERINHTLKTGKPLRN
jgi:3-hydroxyacyl-CoA dehydrogenase